LSPSSSTTYYGWLMVAARRGPTLGFPLPPPFRRAAAAAARRPQRWTCGPRQDDTDCLRRGLSRLVLILRGGHPGGDAATQGALVGRRSEVCLPGLCRLPSPSYYTQEQLDGDGEQRNT
jgi:hypothetical protein